MNLQMRRDIMDIDDVDLRKSKTKPLLPDESRAQTRRALYLLRGLAAETPSLLNQLVAFCGPWLRVHLGRGDSLFGDSELRRLEAGLKHFKLSDDVQKAFIQKAVETEAAAKRAKEHAEAAAAEGATTPKPVRGKPFSRKKQPPTPLPPMPVNDTLFDKLAEALDTPGRRADMIYALKRVLHASKNSRKGLARYISEAVPGNEDIKAVEAIITHLPDSWTIQHVWATLVYIDISAEEFLEKWAQLSQ
jgi:hypothetical protein